jgi:hypothetical protein
MSRAQVTGCDQRHQRKDESRDDEKAGDAHDTAIPQPKVRAGAAGRHPSGRARLSTLRSWFA